MVDWADDDYSVNSLLGEWKERLRGSDRYLYFLARLDGEPVGVLEGHHDWANWGLLEEWQHLESSPNARASYVSSLFVRESARRRGVGGALLDRFIADAQEQGRALVVAWPDEDEEGRLARLKLNESRGFVFAPYPGGVREPWLMTLSLT